MKRLLILCSVIAAFAAPLAPTRVNPASSQIAFASKRDGNWEIYVMGEDGKHQTRLTRRASEDRFPLWSPDHRKIAFATETGGWELWVMDADGAAAKHLASNIIVKSTRGWSPDGSRVAFSAREHNNVDVYTVEPESGNVRRITSSPADDRDPFWSPDGKQIVFTSDRTGNRQLYVMRADGTDVQRLTSGDSTAESPSWSPDGRRISFVCGSDLCVVNADGRFMRRLSHDVHVTRDLPRWSPDGANIMFQVVDGTNYDIGVVAAGGGAYRRIAHSPAYDGSYTWSSDGAHVAFISGRSNMDALYITDADGRNTRQMTTSASLTPMWDPPR